MTHNNYTSKVKAPSTSPSAACYARVSTSEQATEGVSLDAQLAALRTYARLKGWDTFDQYSDGGFSGGSDDRPAFQRLMHDARTRRFNVIMVAKLDRFFRNLKHLVNYIGELDDLGVSFVAVQEGLDTSTPMGKFTLHILGVIAEFERKRIGERMRDARRHRVGLGQWSSGRTPFGYRFSKAQKALQVDEVEARAVRFIFHTYTTESIGVMRLAERLNEQCFPTPRMGRRKHTTWQAATVKHILKHPGYGGGPNERWPFFTPPIVDADMWASAQARLANNRRFQPSRHVSDYQGKLRCGLCGHTLRIAYSHEYRKWECPGRLKRLHLDGSPRCTLPRFDAVQLEKQLDTQMPTIFNSREQFLDYCLKTAENLEAECQQLEARLKPLNAEADRVKEDMVILDARLEMRRISPEDYKARMGDAKKRLAGVEARQGAADPLLLRKLIEVEATRKAYVNVVLFLCDPDHKGQVVVDGSVVKLVPGRVKASAPRGEFHLDFAHVVGSVTDSMVGLVYPDHIEVKASVELGQSLASSSCRNDKPLSLPLSVTVDVREAAHSGRW